MVVKTKAKVVGDSGKKVSKPVASETKVVASAARKSAKPGVAVAKKAKPAIAKSKPAAKAKQVAGKAKPGALKGSKFALKRLDMVKFVVNSYHGHTKHEGQITAKVNVGDVGRVVVKMEDGRKLKPWVTQVAPLKARASA